MKKNYIARRRGTSVAAAALSFALVAPFAQPVAYAQEPPAAEADQNTDAPQADVSTTDVPTNGGDEKAIYSPGQASQKGTISGSVKEIVEAKIGFGNVQDSGKPLEGVKVYAQWYEGAKTQHSSPVYYTESDANGNFTINMAPYVDAAGVARKFEADASVGETVPQRDHKREKIRVWTELPEDMKDKYRLVHQPAAGIFPAIGDVATPTLQGDGPWGGNKVSEMTIQYAQKDKLPQHLPEEKWAESVGKASNNGTYAGRAFWNLHVLLGGLNHNAISDFNSKDLPAPGMKVVGSYLNDEAVTKIEEHVKSNFAGKTLRGRDWTTADEAGLQKWINEQVAADPEGWIAETVTTTTGADGRFALKWKGLYGNNHTGTGGGINPDADKLHKLAGSWEEGSWLNGNKNSKHVNMDWSYISIYDKDGNPLPDNIGTLYPWALGNWAGPTRGGANAQLFGGGTTFIEPTVDGYTGWNIALVPQALKFDVVDKNTTDNWANLGDKVQTYTAGLPISDDLNYYIEWFDKDGNSVKTCETAKADAATKIPSCELEVPADAQTGDTYTARLKVADGDPDPKNDLVLALDAFAVSRDYLEYDPVDAKKDEEATSEPKFDNPETGPEETKPDQAKFELGKLPEGVTEDQVAVDPATGVVTFTPNADQAGKTFDFPVVMRDEALQVPVLDENGDPVKDESGNPKNQGRIVARADATFKVADLTANTVEPAYEGKLVVPGEETKSAPTFTDKEGKDVTAPEGSKFKITDGFTAPDGYEVKIDENTGEITVTFPDKSKLSKDTVEEFDVPVTVTYPDGSTDKADAKFKLDTDGDGTLDSKDGDDDNDGFTDEEEKDAGTNPKDPSESPAKAALEDKTVVEGKPVDPVKVDATVPAEGTVSVTGLPEGLSYNPETGEITGTPTKLSDWGKTEETRDFPVKVEVKDKDGKVVATDEASWTVQRDTDGDGEPDVIDEDDDNDGFTDEQEKEAGTDPKNPNSKPETPVVPDASVVTDPVTVVEGQETDPFDTANNVPEGGKVEVDNLPGGLTVDPETGKVTGTPENLDDWGKDEEERDVTVTVTITDADGNEVAKEDKVITVQRDTDGDGIPDVTDEDDDNDGFTDEQEKEAGTDPKDPNSKPSEGGGVKDTTPPTVDAIKPGDKTISGTGDRPNEDIIVNLPDGTKVETETDKNGKWTIEVPAGVELKPGDKVTVSDGDGNKATEQVGIDTGKCVATSLGFGLPLLALIPLGLATQMEIPGLSNVVADANAQLQAANTRIQQQLGLFNPEIAAQVDAANRQLAQFGTDIGTVAGGLALIAAGILAGTLIYDNCSPNGGGSSVKDLELKGSSGKTYAGSSKKEDKAGEKAADKK